MTLKLDAARNGSVERGFGKRVYTVLGEVGGRGRGARYSSSNVTPTQSSVYIETSTKVLPLRAVWAAWLEWDTGNALRPRFHDMGRRLHSHYLHLGLSVWPLPQHLQNKTL